MSSEYRKVNSAAFRRPGPDKSAEARYWKRFRQPYERLEPAAVSHVEFRKVEPYDLVYTASTRLQSLSGTTLELKGTFSRFKDVAFSGSLKPDGKVIAAGVANGEVKVFNYESRKLLRLLKAHEEAVRVVRFGSADVGLITGSDDKTVRTWDIGTGEVVRCFKDANDYVRCLEPMFNSSLFVAGSMDGVIRLYDARQEACAMVLNSGKSVSSLAALPGGAMVASSSGNELKLWDIVGGGKLMKTMINHQKPVSCLSLDGSKTRILSAGLDRMIKVVEIGTLRVSHTIRTEEAPLSVAMAPDNGRFAYGTAQGRVVVRSMKGWTVAGLESESGMLSSDENEEDISLQGHSRKEGGFSLPKSTLLHGGTRKHWMRGQNSAAADDAIIIASKLKAALKPFDAALKRFEYREALLAALRTRQAPIVCAVMEELAQRGGLLVALSSHSEQDLEALLSFLQKYIVHPHYSALLLDVGSCVLDLYARSVGSSIAIDEMFFKLRNRLLEEVAMQKRMLAFKGALSALLTTTSIASGAVQTPQ